MKKIHVLIIAAIMLISCGNDDDSTPESGLNIRLANVSSFNYTNIIVDTSTGETNFNDLRPGQKSDYKSFQRAYRYAFVELEISGNTYTIQPIDYVGEIPLEDGNYTYIISANDSQDRYGKLNITLVED